MPRRRRHASRPLGCLAGALYSPFLVCLTLLTPANATAPTPPPTTSSDCPAPLVDTRRFLSAAAISLRALKGVLEVVPVTQEATRERGLMCVVRVPHSRGMLFVFPPPDRLQSFWMKDTLVPLDMVFVTTAGEVTAVAANVPATPAGTSDDAVARRQGFGGLVLELGAGEAARHGIVKGTKLRFPALSAK